MPHPPADVHLVLLRVGHPAACGLGVDGHIDVAASRHAPPHHARPPGLGHL